MEAAAGGSRAARTSGGLKRRGETHALTPRTRKFGRARYLTGAGAKRKFARDARKLPVSRLGKIDLAWPAVCAQGEICQAVWNLMLNLEI